MLYGRFFYLFILFRYIEVIYVINNIMKIGIKERYTQDDRTFLVVELVIAIICLFIPFILYLANGKYLYESISAFVDMENSYVFGLLLTMAAMMFIFNGALYFKVEYQEHKHPEHVPSCVMDQSHYNKKNKGKWYNIVFGLALVGVVVFPYNRTLTMTVLHYFFATIFFLGSALVIFFIHDPEDKWKNRFLAIGSIACLVVSVVDNSIMSLFWSETIALIIIGVHYILDSRRIWIQFV